VVVGISLINAKQNLTAIRLNVIHVIETLTWVASWLLKNTTINNFKNKYGLFSEKIQVNLVIFGTYVPLFWTTNTEFADKKTHSDYKFGLLDYFYICDK